jgi:hypothetical protein
VIFHSYVKLPEATEMQKLLLCFASWIDMDVSSDRFWAKTI